MPDHVMNNWLLQRAHLTPERIGLVYGDLEWTFEEINREVKSLAQKLAGRGVEPGQHVAFLMDNHPDTVFLIHALHYLHVVMVPLNKRLSAAELNFQLVEADVTWLIVDKNQEKMAQRLLFNNVIMIEALHDTPVGPFIEPEKTVSLTALHSIIFTSGTTGKAKGVMLSYGNHWWSATGSALNLGLHADDRWLCTVPLFHVSGLSIIMRSVIYGITMVLESSFDPVKFNLSIHHNRVTIASVVSVMLIKVLDSKEFKPLPSSFRCMLLGGGPAPQPLLKRCKDNQIPVFQTYGLSESASQIVTLAPEDSMRKLGSAGKPLFPSQVKIEPIENSAPNDHEGEIFIKGPNVTCGYYKKEQINKERIQDGWLATGDVGYLDEEGFLYVLDRRKDMFISGGENIYPAEIEACLLQNKHVFEAGVIGVENDIWGKVPVAFVVLKESKTTVTRVSLIDHCRKQLAAYKVPKWIQFVDMLPRNASSKVVRKDLYTLFQKEGNHEG